MAARRRSRADVTSTAPEEISVARLRRGQAGRRLIIAALVAFLALGVVNQFGVRTLAVADSAEIIGRAALIFTALFVILRGMGKKELSEMTGFELLMLVIIGDLVQPGIMKDDTSITGALLAVGTITCLVLLLSYLDFRWPRVRPLLEGHPVIVVRDGHVFDEILQIERVSIDELLAAAREHGIADMRTVTIAVLESDGKFSFIPGTSDQDEHRPV